jgi:ATP-dependent Clp protease ATP-binding subunit ClpA
VVVLTDEAGNAKLGFEYPEGPVTPRAEKLPEPRRAKKRRASPRRKPSGPGGNNPPPGPGRGSVPKVPLVKV